MPFKFDPLDEDKDQQQGRPQMTGGGLTFSGSGSGSSGLQTDKAPAQKGTNRQGSGFVGLDQYMAANKGNQFGRQFTGKVSDSLNSAQQGLEASKQGFAQASNQGSTDWNTVGEGVTGVVDNAGSGTTDEDKKKVTDAMGATYKGPESYSGSSWANQGMGGVQSAAQQGRALQSEGGRFALLDQYFGRPSYSTGQKTLDNMLVGSDRGLSARTSYLGNKANTLYNKAADDAQDMNNLAIRNKGMTADAAKQARDYVTGALSGFETGLKDRFDSYKTGAQEYNDNVGSLDKWDLLDPETRNLVGSRMYGLSLEDFMSNPDAFQDSDIQKFASAEDYAKYKALAGLAGEDPTLLHDETQAGTLGENAGRSQFNTQGFTDSWKANKAAYDTKRSGLASLLEGLRGYVPEEGDTKYNDWPTYVQAFKDLQALNEQYGITDDELYSYLNGTGWFMTDQFPGAPATPTLPPDAQIGGGNEPAPSEPTPPPYLADPEPIALPMPEPTPEPMPVDTQTPAPETEPTEPIYVAPPNPYDERVDEPTPAPEEPAPAPMVSQEKRVVGDSDGFAGGGDIFASNESTDRYDRERKRLMDILNGEAMRKSDYEDDNSLRDQTLQALYDLNILYDREGGLGKGKDTELENLMRGYGYDPRVSRQTLVNTSSGPKGAQQHADDTVAKVLERLKARIPTKPVPRDPSELGFGIGNRASAPAPVAYTPPPSAPVAMPSSTAAAGTQEWAALQQYMQQQQSAAAARRQAEAARRAAQKSSNPFGRR